MNEAIIRRRILGLGAMIRQPQETVDYYQARVNGMKIGVHGSSGQMRLLINMNPRLWLFEPRAGPKSSFSCNYSGKRSRKVISRKEKKIFAQRVKFRCNFIKKSGARDLINFWHYIPSLSQHCETCNFRLNIPGYKRTFRLKRTWASQKSSEINSDNEFLRRKRCATASSLVRL